MPLDVVNIAASEVILRNSGNGVDKATIARTSIAAGLIPGVLGLVVPLVVARSQKANGGGSTAEGTEVPNVADGNTTLDQATQKLATSRFGISSHRAFSADVKSGIVISQTPKAGTIRPLDSRVSVVVSDGPPPPQGVPGSGSVPATEDELFAAKLEIESQLSSAKQEIENQIAGLGTKIDTIAKRAPAAGQAESVKGGKAYAG